MTNLLADIPAYQPRHPLSWQNNRTYEFTVQRQRKGGNIYNNVPYELNFKRPQWTPWDTALYPAAPIATVLQEETPAIPLARKQQSSYAPITHDPATVHEIRPYIAQSTPWPARGIV